MNDAPSLKGSLVNWTGFPKLERRFEPRRTRAAAIQVTRQLGDIEPKMPEPYDLSALYRRVMESWHRHHSIAKLSSRDLQRLPWVLFYAPPVRSRSRQQGTTGWLGGMPSVVQEYQLWLSRGRRTRSILALLHEFLRVYPTDLPTFDDLRKTLRAAVVDGRSSPPSLRKWSRRCMDFKLLEADGGTPFVQKIVASTEAPDEILTTAGLDGGLARCGFLKSGIRKYLSSISPQLARNRLDASTLDQVLALLECEGKLRFDERPARLEIASAFLRPFVDQPPGAETKNRLRPFFVRHFGHPNLRSGKHRWSGVPEDIRRVVIRWLVERVLDQFFLLIKETALDRHWRYREAFWRAYVRQDLIDHIWFLLGPRAANQLRQMSRNEDVTETTGSLQGAGGDQSVLILRMPGVTIAEWSHNGKCRFWLDGNRKAPKLYQDSYHRYDLQWGRDYAQAHHGSQYGGWQDKIANWIEENTGARVNRDDYMLRESQLRTTSRSSGVRVSSSTKQSKVPREVQSAFKQRSASVMSTTQSDRDLQWTATATANAVNKGRSTWTFSYEVQLTNHTRVAKAYHITVNFLNAGGNIVAYRAYAVTGARLRGLATKRSTGTCLISAEKALRVTGIRLEITVLRSSG